METDYSQPDTLCLAIVTVKRDPLYLYQTLASLFASDALVINPAKG